MDDKNCPVRSVGWLAVAGWRYLRECISVKADYIYILNYILYMAANTYILRLRPYHDEHTRSRLITEVKHRRAGIVLGWGTAWEHPVP